MKGERVLFEVDGEKELEGVIKNEVMLPRHTTNEQSSPTIPCTYYQIVDDEGKVHTVSPAAVKQVTTDAPISAYKGFTFEFLRIADKHLKVDSIVEKINADKRGLYHVTIDIGKKVLSIIPRDLYNRRQKEKLEKQQNEQTTIGD